MQSVIALLYIGMLAFKSVPLRECSKSVTINPQAIYVSHARSVHSKTPKSVNLTNLFILFNMHCPLGFSLLLCRMATTYSKAVDRNV